MRDSASDSAAEPDANAVRACLERVVSSPEFAPAPRLVAFLRFIVEETIAGRRDSVKETTVAVHVFGRSSDFDSRFDSVVRAQGTQLRRRLREYYANAGSGDAVVIEVPPGSYVPVFRRRAEDAAEPAQARRRRWWIPAIAAGALILAGLAAWWLIPGWRGQTPSLAVLPFMNLDEGPGSEHISEGFVEDLTTDLAGLPGLRVAARTSAFQFRGKSGDVRGIGRALGAGAVLEGSVRTDGGKVRITAQLIDARSGYHLWSNRYELDLARVWEVEAEIRGAVAHALGVDRAPAAQTRATRHVPPPEALDAYWRGRYIRADWQRFPESLSWFERAVKLDPLFAGAWAALASVHSARAFQSVSPVDQEAAQAREAARRAMELDGTLAEPHAALAQIAYAYDHDWATSERRFHRALEMNPNDADVRRNYALGLTSQARFGEATAQLKLAQQADPLTFLSSNILAVTLFCARRYDEAMREAERHLRMDPDYLLARFTLGNCEAAKGDLAAAISEYRKVLERMRAVEVLGRLGTAQARAGRPAEARATLAELESIERKEKTAGVALARVCTGLGEKRQAIDWLGTAAGDHLTDVAFIGVDPAFDPLRQEPDFQALCARLNVPRHP
jgi:serine/threonine-protein kinase